MKKMYLSTELFKELFTVVVTKHVWPYFQSRFPKTSSERVSSRWVRSFAEQSLKSKWDQE
jgi:hypothetical protein